MFVFLDILLHIRLLDIRLFTYSSLEYSEGRQHGAYDWYYNYDW